MTVSLIVQPMVCIVVIAGKICILSLIISFLGVVLCGASFNVLAIISYDRYLHLKKLKSYNSYMTSRKLKALVSVALIFPALAGCFVFHKDMDIAFYFFGGLMAPVLMGTISFCYYKSWKIFKNQGKTISARNNRTEKQWRVAKSMGLIVLCCVASWLSYLIYKVLEGISHLIKNDCEGNNCRQYMEYPYFCLFCGFANSSINPFLHYIRNKEIRQRMKSLLFFSKVGPDKQKKLLSRSILKHQRQGLH